MRAITLPGQVHGLAAPGPSGPVYVTSYGEDLSITYLTVLGPDGTAQARHEFRGQSGAPLVSERGTVWVRHGLNGAVLSELDSGASVLRSVTPEHEPHEHLGAVVLLPDGFCVLWLPAARAHVIGPERYVRIARHDKDGRCRWSTPLPLGYVSFPRAGAEPERPWLPRTLDVSPWNPLLVSADRVAATVADYSSGLAVTFFLEASTGKVLALTPPAPSHSKAIIGPGEFLLGEQGYGILRTVRYDASGTPRQEWPSHLLPVIDRHGGIRGPESENVLPSRSRFRGLEPDGALRDGPALDEYYMTYPALDRDGTTVFWRDGRLLAIDAGFALHELYAAPDERKVMSRVLLLERGTVVFALDNQLQVFEDTGLAPLDDGPWPCGDGNLRGNPVTHQVTEGDD